MKNADMPAMPVDIQFGKAYHADFDGSGFTKRERACIDLRIPESGDEELDALIRKALLRDAAISIVAGLAANHTVSQSDAGVEAMQLAADIIHQLERTHADP